VACCDVVNRGLAYADGKLFFNTLDNQTIALDAASGKEVWRYRSGDIRAGETRTMAPLVVKGRVLIGNSGAEYGVRGWATALDAADGKEGWGAYSTGAEFARAPRAALAARPRCGERQGGVARVLHGSRSRRADRRRLQAVLLD